MEKETKTKKPRAPKIQPSLRAGLPKKDNLSVDWRKIISPEYLVLNTNYWARHGKDVDMMEADEKSKLIAESPDEGVFILLAGFRQLAEARGIKETRYKVEDRADNRSVVSCTMTLLPTVDEPYETVISGIGTSSPETTSDKFFVFADAIASNRAFCRALRGMANIVAVSFEEINPNEEKEKIRSTPEVENSLIKKLEEAGLSSDDIPDLAKKGEFKLNDGFNGSLATLTPSEIFTLISIIKKNYKTDE